LVACEPVITDLDAVGEVVYEDTAAGDRTGHLETVHPLRMVQEIRRVLPEHQHARVLVGHERVASGENRLHLGVPSRNSLERDGIGPDHGRGADPLQSQRFVHDRVFVIVARTDEDQVARSRGIDRFLNRVGERIRRGRRPRRHPPDRARTVEGQGQTDERRCGATDPVVTGDHELPLVSRRADVGRGQGCRDLVVRPS